MRLIYSNVGNSKCSIVFEYGCILSQNMRYIVVTEDSRVIGDNPETTVTQFSECHRAEARQYAQVFVGELA